MTTGLRMHSLWAQLTLATVAFSFQRRWASPSRNGEENERMFRKHLEKSPVTPVPTKGSSKATVSVTSQRLLIKGKPPLSHWEGRAQPWFRWSGPSHTGSGANRVCQGAASSPGDLELPALMSCKPSQREPLIRNACCLNREMTVKVRVGFLQLPSLPH